MLPILVLILFGIIDYGLYFNASLEARAGVHDAVRQAVVQPSSGGNTACDTGIANAPTDITRLVCRVLDSTATATATKYVDVKLPDGWVVGEPIIVCERLDVAGLTGLVPFPDSGHIKDISVLTIEQPDTDPALAQTNLEFAAALPTGDWTWCAQ